MEILDIAAFFIALIAGVGGWGFAIFEYFEERATGKLTKRDEFFNDY